MLRKDLDDLESNGHMGDWCFMNDDALIAIRYGEEVFTGMVILPIAPELMAGKPHWKCNGNYEAPTLSPSILVHKTVCNPEWHGFLTDGKLITV
jgi:hypothetical protein